MFSLKLKYILHFIPFFLSFFWTKQFKEFDTNSNIDGVDSNLLYIKGKINKKCHLLVVEQQYQQMDT